MNLVLDRLKEVSSISFFEKSKNCSIKIVHVGYVKLIYLELNFYNLLEIK